MVCECIRANHLGIHTLEGLGACVAGAGERREVWGRVLLKEGLLPRLEPGEGLGDPFLGPFGGLGALSYRVLTPEFVGESTIICGV